MNQNLLVLSGSQHKDIATREVHQEFQVKYSNNFHLFFLGLVMFVKIFINEEYFRKKIKTMELK